MTKIGSRIGTAVLVLALLGLLAGSVWLAVHTWTSVQGPPLPTQGYVAMVLGVVFSVVIGCGLMALVFYSNRYGYDERSNRDQHVTRDDSRP
jgi:formate hydrogenlyase subunit 3/multisubunit Na+/H+ antiporter MnhD subunit